VNRKALATFQAWATVALASAATQGCGVGDPGWVYRVEAATPVRDNGVRYEVRANRDLAVRVSASAFTIELTVDADVFSLGNDLPPDTRIVLRLTDAFGRPVALEQHVPPVSSCRLGGRPSASFPRNRTVCSASAAFVIDPVREPNLATVTLTVDGFPRSLGPPVRITLVSD